MTARQKQIYRKLFHVIKEYESDLDSDIEGCDGNELREIEQHLKCCWLLKNRLRRYLTGKVDNPRGIIDGEKVATPLPSDDEIY